MFAICLSLAAGTVGDHWIASGTHPVYSAKVLPLITDDRDARRQEMERECAELHDRIEKTKEVLAGDGWKARLGDAVRIRLGDELVRLRVTLREVNEVLLSIEEMELRRQAEMLRRLTDEDNRMKLWGGPSY